MGTVVVATARVPATSAGQALAVKPEAVRQAAVDTVAAWMVRVRASMDGRVSRAKSGPVLMTVQPTATASMANAFARAVGGANRARSESAALMTAGLASDAAFALGIRESVHARVASLVRDAPR